MWYFEDKPVLIDDIDGKYIGFVYEITDTVNGKKYIGKKKLFSTTRKPPLKGQKRKRTIVKESDWGTYYGSNDTIKELVLKDGPERFKRKILRFCETTGEMSYHEAKAQFEAEALLRPDEYYNAFIGLKVHRNHIKHLLK